MSLFGRDLHSLSGAYALDALEGAERERFERHLARCRRCADEVRGLQATAANLAFAIAEQPPDDVRRRVLAAATVVPQERAPAAEQEPPQRARSRSAASPWVPRMSMGFAAVCLIVALGFGIVGLTSQQRYQRAQAQNQAIAAVLSAPDAQVASESTTHGGTATVVLSRSERKVVVSTDGLPTLPSSQVYQLWFIGPSRIASAGLVPTATNGKTTPVLASGLETDDKLGMTVEPAGGTRQPTTTPILEMTLPA